METSEEEKKRIKALEEAQNNCEHMGNFEFGGNVGFPMINTLNNQVSSAMIITSLFCKKCGKIFVNSQVLKSN